MKGRQEPQEWYFFKAGSDAGLKAGPFSWERLLVQAQRGSLEPRDVVWDPNSGWREAAEVPGLFPDLPAASSVQSTFADAQALTPSGEHRDRFWWYWIAAAGTLIIVGAALGLYFGLARGGGDDADGIVFVTTTQATVTTESTATTQATVTTESTAGSTSDVEPAVYLDRGDSGTRAKFRVGERVRVELEPWAGDGITQVIWVFGSSDSEVVREVDRGSEVVDGVVVSAWLELEGVTAGNASVRAKYKYPNGTTQGKFVAYLLVSE